MRWLVLVLLLAGCSKIPSFLTGGGPNVAANTQIGKENTQSIGLTTVNRPVARPSAPVDTIDQSTTNNTEIDPLLLILLILGWLAPSPQEIGRGLGKWLRDLIRRK